MDKYQYSVYSIVSVIEGQAEDDINKVLNYAEELKLLKNSDEAKRFLVEKFNIKDSIYEYPLGGNAFLSVSDKKKWLSINIQYDNQNLTYTFGK